MINAIEILKSMVSEHLPEKDDGEVYIPGNVDANIRNDAIKECIKVLEQHEHRS